MHAKLIERTALTNTITSFSFEPEKPLSFTAGQYITLELDGHQEHGQPAQRPFAISSSPNDDYLTITSRVDAQADSAFKRALAKLEAGASVTITPPAGSFVLPNLLQTPLVFVADDVAVTPFASMLGWLADTDENRSIKMLYNVPTEDDIIFQDVFDAAEQHVTIVVNEPSGAWGGERGPLTGEMIHGLAQPTDDTLFYLSGPSMQRWHDELVAIGVNQQQIVLNSLQ